MGYEGGARQVRPAQQEAVGLFYNSCAQQKRSDAEDKALKVFYISMLHIIFTAQILVGINSAIKSAAWKKSNVFKDRRYV